MGYVIEGTFREVQERLRALPLEPESHLRLVVDEKDLSGTSLEACFANAERRNGLIVMPLEYEGKPLTTEIVKMLSEGD